MFGEAILEEEEEDLEYDHDDDDDERDDQSQDEQQSHMEHTNGNRVPFAPIQQERGPSIRDRMADYWSDFMNYVENSSIWKYIFGQNWYKRFKRGAAWLIDQGSFRFTFDDLMLIMTLFVIFGINIELAVLPASADKPFSTALAVCMFFFIFELAVNSWSKSKVKVRFSPKFKFKYSGYIFSFYWFFDLIAIIAIWPDIPWIASALHMEGLASSAVQGNQNYTNAGRLVRLVRLVRFIRLYRLAAEKRRALKQEKYLQELVDRGDLETADAQKLRHLATERQSKLGSKLSKVIIHYVIIIVLIMLIVIPVLDFNYIQRDHGDSFAIDFLHDAVMNPTLNNISKAAILDVYINAFTHQSITAPQSNIVFLDVDPDLGVVVDNKYRIENLRRGTREIITLYSNESGTAYFTQGIYDNRLLLYKSSQYTIYLTLCVAFVLIFGYITFTKDVKRLVIKPIERMMNMVEIVAQDPLQPLEDAKFELVQQGKYRSIMGTSKVKSGQYETLLLEKSLEKVTGLLRVGFGEAGAGIIRANLNIDTMSSNNKAMMNALIPGIRIYAIFGFCDIHHFEEINKALSGDVLTFVNTIAEIVHGSVHTWGGQVNKNLGNAFVVVWRIGDEDTLAANLQSTAIAIKSTVSPTAQSTKLETASTISGKKRAGSRGTARDSETRSRAVSSGIAFDDSELLDSDDENDQDQVSRSESGSALSERTSKTAVKKNAFKIDIRKIPGVDVLADGAMISYLKIVAEINRSRAVLKYRADERLQAIHEGAPSPVMMPKTPRAMSPDQLNNNNAAAVHLNDPNQFKVRMGFGLHAGWGIEGAVGSMYKVDATYLSPHVNMAARLETASKQYKVPLLMSHIFHELLSDVVKTKTRQIDTVTVKGSEVPIGIFTYDCLQDQEFTKRTKSDMQLYDGVSRKKTDSQNSASTALESQLTDDMPASEPSSNPPPTHTAISRASYEPIPVRRPSSIAEDESSLPVEDFNGQRTPFSASTPGSAQQLQSRPRLLSDNPPRVSTFESFRPRLSSDNPPRMSTYESPAISRPRLASDNPPRLSTIDSFSLNSPALNSSKKIVITSLPRNSPSMRASMMTSKPDVKRRSFIIEEELREEHLVDQDKDKEHAAAHPPISMDSIYSFSDNHAVTFSTPNIAFSPRSSSTKSKLASIDTPGTLPPPPPPPSAATPSAIRLSTSDSSISNEPKRRISGVTYNLVPTVINIDYNERNYDDDDDKQDNDDSNRKLALDYPDTNVESKSGMPSSPFMPIPADDRVPPPSTEPPPKKSLLAKLFPELIEPPRFSPVPITTIMASKETIQSFTQGSKPKMPDLTLSNTNTNTNANRNSISSTSEASDGNESNPLSQFMTPADSIEEIMNNDTDMVKLRRHITPEFMDTFKEGFKYYLQGDWPRARVYFERSDELMAIAAPSLGGDGPSQTLLNYMKSLEFKSPKGWNGYRALTNK